MTFSSRRRIVFGAGPVAADVDGALDQPRAGQLEHQAARPSPGRPSLISGARPFSKRPDASVRRPSRCDVRCRFGPFQLAASISTRVVVGWTSERWPPMTPAIEVGPSSSHDQQHVGVERALDVVERRHLLAVAGAADDQVAAGDEVPVERVQRLAR